MPPSSTAELLSVTLVLVTAGTAGIGGAVGPAVGPEALAGPGATAPAAQTWVSQYVFRVVDAEGAVVCHVAALAEGSGVACLPLGQTGLDAPAAAAPSSVEPGSVAWVSRNLFRVVDGRADVACYVAALSEGSGIDCLPLASTTLRPAINRSSLTVDRPSGTYVVGTRTDVGGEAPEDVESVALYARPRGAGNWTLLDVDGDGTPSSADAVDVTADGRWGADVTLSTASRAFATPGEAELAAVDAAAATDANGSLRRALAPGAVADATGASVALVVEAPADPTVFRDVGDQVATEDGVVTVAGVATGTQSVLVLIVDSRGRLASDVVATDRSGAFEEDVALATADGRPLGDGVAVGVVLSPGRDGVVGDGEVGGRPVGDLDEFAASLQEATSTTRLTQRQVLDRVAAETVDDAGSDDLRVLETFLLTDARTSIESVGPAYATGTLGVEAVPAGEQLVVRGHTNRRPADNTIFVDLRNASTDRPIALATADGWGQDGGWTATLSTADLDPGTYVVVADDGDDSDRVTVRVTAAGRPAPSGDAGNETAVANATAAATPTARQSPGDRALRGIATLPAPAPRLPAGRLAPAAPVVVRVTKNHRLLASPVVMPAVSVAGVR